jgi:halogenation protein CepH
MMVDLPKKCDVVVLGGGPSGSSAAGFLSQQGYDVVLLEKLTHPRDVVGESLIPHFWKYADLLGVSDAIDEAGFVAKSGAVQTWQGVSRKMNFKPFGYKKPPLHVERGAFDHILLKNTARLGATVSEQTQVKKVKLGDEESEVFYVRDGEEGSIKAKFVVDSTGQAALVSKQEGTRMFDDNFRYTAMWAYFKGGHFTTYDGERYPASEWKEHPPVTYVSAIGDSGYSWLWHIVLRGKTSVGLILAREYVEQLKKEKKSVKEEYFRLVRETPIFNELMEDSEYIEDSFSAIRDYAYAAKDFVIGDRCYVTGDGAAFVDPINSVGVPFSMFTGYLAAWSIDQTLQGSQNDAARIYRMQLKNRVSVYKLLALPPHLTDPAESEMNLVRQALKQERQLEQELILVQSQLTSRPDRIRNFYEQEGISTESDKIQPWTKQW